MWVRAYADCLLRRRCLTSAFFLAFNAAFDARLRAHGARHGWAPVPSHAREECLDSSRASKAEGTLSVPLKSLAAGHLQVQLVALVETRKTVPG